MITAKYKVVFLREEDQRALEDFFRSKQIPYVLINDDDSKDESEQVAIDGDKVCTRCGETKPLSEYPRDKYAKDGHRSECKECGKTIRYSRATYNRDLIVAIGRYKNGSQNPASKSFLRRLVEDQSFVDAVEQAISEFSGEEKKKAIEKFQVELRRAKNLAKKNLD